jgi:hypothetical protein
MTEEIFESTAKGKAIFYGLIIFACALYALLECDWMANILHPDTKGLSYAELEEWIRSDFRRVAILSPIVFVAHVLLAYHEFRFGKRIEKSGQYPPPGANLPFSMKIRRGEPAMKQAHGYYFSSALTVVVGCIPVIYVIIRLVQ